MQTMNSMQVTNVGNKLASNAIALMCLEVTGMHELNCFSTVHLTIGEFLARLSLAIPFNFTARQCVE